MLTFWHSAIPTSHYLDISPFRNTASPTRKRPTIPTRGVGGWGTVIGSISTLQPYFVVHRGIGAWRYQRVTDSALSGAELQTQMKRPWLDVLLLQRNKWYLLATTQFGKMPRVEIQFSLQTLQIWNCSALAYKQTRGYQIYNDGK